MTVIAAPRTRCRATLTIVNTQVKMMDIQLDIFFPCNALNWRYPISNFQT